MDTQCLLEQPISVLLTIIKQEFCDVYERESVKRRWTEQYIRYLRHLAKVTMPIYKAVCYVVFSDYAELFLEIREGKNSEGEIKRFFYNRLRVYVIQAIEKYQNQQEKNFVSYEGGYGYSNAHDLPYRRKKVIDSILEQQESLEIKIPVNMQIKRICRNMICPDDNMADCLEILYRKWYSQGWMEQRHRMDDTQLYLENSTHSIFIDMDERKKLAQFNANVLIKQ
jgi:hypothetical protein